MPRDQRNLRLTGRLHPAVTLDQASAAIETIARRLQRDYPATNAGWDARVAPTKEAIAGPDTWLVLALLVTVVGFVLVIACANIANLMLARCIDRRRELAVRAALGASRGRMIRQLVTESLLLGLLGGAAGLLLAYVGLHAILAAAYEPFFELVTIDRNVLGFALVLSLLTSVLFSLLPALHSSRADVSGTLKEAGGRSSGGRGARRSRNALVVAQVALALALLVVAGLVLRTIAAINRIDLGFDPKGLLTLQLDVPEWKYPDMGQVGRFYERLLVALGDLPEVRSAAAATRLPVIEGETTTRFAIDGRPTPNLADRPWAANVTVSPAYFRTVGLPLLRGRLLADQDTAAAPGVAVINREAATRYWKTPDAALGSRIALGTDAHPDRWVQIVGVVGNTVNPDLEAAPSPFVYLPLAQGPQRTLAIMLRADDAAGLAGAARAAVRDADRELAIYQMRTMTEAIDDELSSSRIMMAMFMAFAVLALLLAAAGLYGVMAYSVSQRTQEIGVRMALGAVPRDIQALVVGQGLRLIGVGVLLGLAGAFALAQTTASLLYGVTATDPATYGGVLALLVTVGLLAS